MGQVIPVVDADKAALKEQYLTIRAGLQTIQAEMQTDPTPAKAYAAIDDLAAAMDKMLVVLRNMVT